MTREQAMQAVVAQWLDKASDALTAARREHAAGDLSLAVNRIYYACFYAVSAVLLREGWTFSRHAGVRAAMHEHLVKTGRLPATLGKFYNKAFEDRQEADYTAQVQFESADVRDRIAQAEQFVNHVKAMITSG